MTVNFLFPPPPFIYVCSLPILLLLNAYISTFPFDFVHHLLVCLLQGKLSQPKDDSWSDCAKNGYAGNAMISIGDFVNCLMCFLFTFLGY